MRLKDGSIISSRTTKTDGEFVYPYLFSAQLSHPDNIVSGRRWITEIGLRQEQQNHTIECTILLKTDEVSPRVTAAITVTRPKLIEHLVKKCNPSWDTPGVRLKTLDEDSAKSFLAEIEREQRRNPIVLISPDRDGKYLVTPERVRSLLVGVANVVLVPPFTDTYKIEEIVERRYGAWGGAVNIIFQPRLGDRGMFCESILLKPTEISSLSEKKGKVESEILAIVTHRTNLPYSWKHISLEVVAQAKLRNQLTKSIALGKENEDAKEYVALLSEADRELRIKDEQILSLQSQIESKEVTCNRLESDISGLKHALNGRQSSDVDTEGFEALKPLRSSLLALINKNQNLEQSLLLIKTLFPERVTILESAQNSANESDKNGFKYGDRAFDLLIKFATEYWQALVDGEGDQKAKDIFGRSGFAQNEGSALSTDGKRRRTFHYRGRNIIMEKHLKIGVKDSSAETLRVLFEEPVNKFV